MDYWVYIYIVAMIVGAVIGTRNARVQYAEQGTLSGAGAHMLMALGLAWAVVTMVRLPVQNPEILTELGKVYGDSQVWVGTLIALVVCGVVVITFIGIINLLGWLVTRGSKPQPKVVEEEDEVEDND